MGMGYTGSYADCVEVKTLKKFCKNEYASFLKLIEKKNIDFEDFARAASYSELQSKDADGKRIWSKSIVEAYKEIQDAFEKNTGLSLFLGFHSQDDDGDRYDEVDGAFWCVDGMYKLTDAGKKMEKYVERKDFVQYC